MGSVKKTKVTNTAKKTSDHNKSFPLAYPLTFNLQLAGTNFDIVLHPI